MKTWRVLSRIIGVGAVAALVSFSAPAGAHGGSVTVSDSAGNDYDPMCEVPGPGAETSSCVVTSNDGSSSSTDLLQIVLSETPGTDAVWGTADDRLRATWTLNGHVPVPGDRRSSFDSPRDAPTPLFDGASYFVLFQNKDKQTGYPNPSAGCPRVGTGVMTDEQPNWQDGYYRFLALDVSWTGTDWAIKPIVGTMDASLRPQEEVDLDAEPAMSGRYAYSAASGLPGSTLALEVTGRLQLTNAACASGVYTEVLADHTPGFFSPSGYAGDRIANVFGLTTANRGGERYASDATPTSSAGSTYTRGAVGTADTVAPGPQCSTPTLGGTLPSNPLATTGPCRIDDDAVGNTLLAEFHTSGLGFTF